MLAWSLQRFWGGISDSVRWLQTDCVTGAGGSPATAFEVSVRFSSFFLFTFESYLHIHYLDKFESVAR